MVSPHRVVGGIGPRLVALELLCFLIVLDFALGNHYINDKLCRDYSGSITAVAGALIYRGCRLLSLSPRGIKWPCCTFFTVFYFLIFFFFIHSLLFDWGASLRILISILGGRNCAKTTYINLHHSNAAYIRRRGNTFQEDRKCTTGAGARSCGLYLNIWPHRAES